MDSEPAGPASPRPAHDAPPSRAASPELTGGAGFTFEDTAVAVYLAALLAEETAPGLPGRTVVAVSVQQAPFGEPLDDLIVDGKGEDGSPARLSLQIKHSLMVSAAPSNTDFREIVVRAWRTVQGTRFHPGTDRVGAVVGTVSEARGRALVTACELARASEDGLATFTTRLAEGAGTGANIRGVVADVAEILRRDGATDPDAATFEVLRHFVLVRFDSLHEGATSDPGQLAVLRACLRPDYADRAGALRDALRQVAREGAGRAATFTRAGLLARFRGAFALLGSPRFRHALEVMHEDARLALRDIRNTIGGVSVDRASAVAAVREAVARHRFVQVTGLPGAGKSAVLRALAEERATSGPVLVLKSDRVEERSWHAHAASLGIGPAPLDALLAELAAASGTEHPVLFIDGLDRFGVEQRGVVKDVLRAALDTRGGASWRVVATVRDSGIEPLRTWLPDEVWAGEGPDIVEVGPLGDDEALVVAQALPALWPLLFGNARVREIARRPFFAAVLTRAVDADAGGHGGVVATAARSEVELAQAWWDRGGHAEEGAAADRRQRALLALALAGITSPGGLLPTADLEPEAVEALVRDGVLRREGRGHRVAFTHDIFREWALLHLLLDRGEAWPDEVRTAGEPPVLGRAVELLSQAAFADDVAGWEASLARMETETRMRSQWTRAWLLGPFGSPAFSDKSQAYADAVLRDGGVRCARVATWLQAEKTAPNPVVLDERYGLEVDNPRKRARFADLLAWPADAQAWARYLGWVLDHVDRVPARAWPDVVAALEVWQNRFADVPNAVSERVLDAVHGWLDRLDGEGDDGVLPAALLSAANRDVREALRGIALRAARLESGHRVRCYLSRLRRDPRVAHDVYERVLSFSRLLVPALATELVTLVLEQELDLLPAEVEEEIQRESQHRWHPRFLGVSHHDWRGLGFHDALGSYPPSSLREPFASLFRDAPQEGLRLVRELANHAITAWSQLWRLDHQRRATPVPLVLAFPWGEQTFEGDEQIYGWFRGHGAPTPLASGLMALEAWAFTELERGRDRDSLITEVLRGHRSCATLGIAVGIALQASHVSSATLPLVASQRVWHWDVRRRVSDMERGTNLLGFTRPDDREHAQAVQAGNARAVRGRDIRELAMVSAMIAPVDLKHRLCTAVTAFPDALPFDFEEEAVVPEHMAVLRRRAVIWSALGRPENYAVTTADSADTVEVSFSSPHDRDPDIVQVVEQTALMAECLGLSDWGARWLRGKPPEDCATLPGRVNAARRLDTPDLFASSASPGDERDLRRGAVAAIAAAALVSPADLTLEDRDWAVGVVTRALGTPESDDPMWSPRANVPGHPCAAAAHGLVGMIRRGLDRDAARKALLRLGAHPLELVGAGAIRLCLSLWAEDPALAWTALDLAVALSIVRIDELRRGWRGIRATGLPNAEAAVERASRMLHEQTTVPVTLPELPAPWASPVQGVPGTARTSCSIRMLREPEVALRYDFLQRVLPYLPLEQVMADQERSSAFLTLCDRLLAWTAARLEPPCDGPEARRDRDHPDRSRLYEWRAALCGLLADVALQLPQDEALARVVGPMTALGDEAAPFLLHPFVDAIACRGVMDPPVLATRAVALLSACAKRVAGCAQWQRGRRGDGWVSGYDLPPLVRGLLFVAVEKAELAARFANGDWREIEAIMPVVDHLVREVGDVAVVASSFVELCQRAVEHYPAAIFAEQILTILERQPGMPAGWRTAGIPGRLVNLVQEFAMRARPLPISLRQDLLRILDALVDMGDRRAAALQSSELFRDVRLTAGTAS